MLLSGIVVFLTIISVIYIDNNRLTVSRYNIKSKKIPHGFKNYKILQLSDLHSKEFGNENSKLIKLINKESPDIIVMTGDMINCRDENYQVFLELAKQIASSYEVYFVEGNNETRLVSNNRSNLLENLRKINIKVLENNKEVLYRGNEFINLYGLYFDLKYYRAIHSGYTKETYFSCEDVRNSLGECNKDEYNILLAHNPLFFDSYVKWGADLILSGHIHGGIVRLPYIGGLLSPERKFFPKYSHGQYDKRESSIIVNRGLGTKILMPRIFNPPDISIITLR